MSKTTGADRARRLIALLGHLHEGRTELGPLADELGIPVTELAGDLVTLSLCGVSPYDPYALVPVMVDGDTVEVFGDMPAVRGPVRLSASEAEALAAALQAVGFGASDPLTSRLLNAVAGSTSAENVSRVIRSAIEGHATAVYKVLAVAIDRHEAVAIAHAGAEADSASTRVIEPVRLFAERGAWYVVGWCRRANDWRTFRLDRISSATLTGEPSERHLESPGDADFTALSFDCLPVATLRFTAGLAFEERDWPGGHVVSISDEGETTAEVPYAGPSWLARRVAARLGAVEIVAPEELRAEVRRIAAEAAEAHSA